MNKVAPCSVLGNHVIVSIPMSMLYSRFKFIVSTSEVGRGAAPSLDASLFDIHSRLKVSENSLLLHVADAVASMCVRTLLRLCADAVASMCGRLLRLCVDTRTDQHTDTQTQIRTGTQPYT